MEGAEHRLDAGRVEDVGVVVLGEPVRVEDRREHEDRGEREQAQQRLAVRRLRAQAARARGGRDRRHGRGGAHVAVGGGVGAAGIGGLGWRGAHGIGSTAGGRGARCALPRDRGRGKQSGNRAKGALDAFRRRERGGGEAGNGVARGAAAQPSSASSSRARSCSSFQAPTDARSQGRPGMSRSSTPRAASRSRSATGSGLAKEISVAPARSDAAPRRARARARRAARRARGEQPCALVDGRPTGVREHLEGGQRAGDGLGAQRERVQAPRVLVQDGLQALAGVGEVGVAAAADR